MALQVLPARKATQGQTEQTVRPVPVVRKATGALQDRKDRKDHKAFVVLLVLLVQTVVTVPTARTVHRDLKANKARPAMTEAMAATEMMGIAVRQEKPALTVLQAKMAQRARTASMVPLDCKGM